MKLFIFEDILFVCMHMSLTGYVHIVHGGQKRVLDLLDLTLQEVVSLPPPCGVLGTELRSSKRAGSLNYNQQIKVSITSVGLLTSLVFSGF